MSAKSDLAERVLRRLGWPSIKVELERDTIYNHIDWAKKKWITYAVGQATQEVWFTMMLSAGQYLYDMPEGVQEVVEYSMEPAEMGGINELFTIHHMLYEQGLFGIIEPSNAAGYNLVSYHIARDFLETLARYTPDEYNYKYHPYTNQLEIQPPPPSGNALVIGDYSYDSPGWILVRAFMLRDSTLPDYTDDYLNSDLYTNVQWIEDMTLALSKQTLGMVRRKFSGSTLLGTQGLSLDGADLIQEGKDEYERLMEDLVEKEAHEGHYITMG